jgi:hypothetical protein
MTMPFNYSTTYTLDKSHFSETFDESIIETNSIKAYAKSIGLMLAGFAFVYFTDFAPYFAWFIVVLGVIETLSVYFKRSWWLARQMISQAANTKLTLTIDENGVRSKSLSVESQILWEEIIKIEKTRQGWLLYHTSGRNYLSGRCLSDDANAFISSRAVSKEK